MAVLIKNRGHKPLVMARPSVAYGNYEITSVDGSKHVSISMYGDDSGYHVHMGMNEAEKVAVNMLRSIVEHTDRTFDDIIEKLVASR